MSCVTLSQHNFKQRQLFCPRVLAMRNMPLFFHNESDFNFHMLINSGYSPVNQDVVSFQPRPRRNNNVHRPKKNNTKKDGFLIQNDIKGSLNPLHYKSYFNPALF